MLDMSVYRKKVEEQLKEEDLLNKAALNKQLLSDLNVIGDLSISRDKKRVPWGIAVPKDDKQTVYVWLDALLSYLTGALQVHQKPSLEELPQYSQIHILGKDILKFHGIYWLYLRHILGIEMPVKLIVHDHWMKEKKKMSKSIGNVVDPIDLLKRFSRDEMRVYMLAEGPQETDMVFC